MLITGPTGVGTTTLVRELARRATAGELPFLRRKRLLHVDCRDVPEIESGAKLARIIAHVAGRTDLIVCLDGLGAMLRGPGGTDHVPALRSALKERRIHLIGVLSGQEYDDLLATDHALRELTTRIDMTEPDRASARDMVRQAADALEAEFRTEVEDRAVDRAVVMSGDYILNQRLPLAAVKVLRRACEDLDYRRTQLGDTRAVVDTEDVVRVIAEVSGVPAGQIAGTGGERTDYEQALGGSVFGQQEAVEVVASELRRIKSGLAGASSGPASVMLFAGLTGTGKTELAKTVASFYSSSKRLQTYPMENFSEPHSVSGIIGSPPGYIGFERGGRLINELNADPYCVFLLDEAEKAHPEVWRPFLNLFDEGWIVDQRGVKAHGDRAIFILTSNAGQEIISRMTREGRSDEEIVSRREGSIAADREPRAGRPCLHSRVRGAYPPDHRVPPAGPGRDDRHLPQTRRPTARILAGQTGEGTHRPRIVDPLCRRSRASDEREVGRQGGRPHHREDPFGPDRESHPPRTGAPGGGVQAVRPHRTRLPPRRTRRRSTDGRPLHPGGGGGTRP